MIVPIVGFPTGQSVERNGIVVVLTYFNRYLENRLPDGKVTFLIANLNDTAQSINVILATAENGSDFFKERFKLRVSAEPKSATSRSFQSEKIKTASFAKFAIMFDLGHDSAKRSLALADLDSGQTIEYVEM